MSESGKEVPENILWKTLWGSHMWGMETAESDRDQCTVYQLDHRTVTLGAFEPSLLQRHRTGWHTKSAGGDEHWYELGRALQLLLKGSLTMLYGVISPVVVSAESDALSELRSLLQEHKSRASYRALLRDVRDGEKLMKRTKDEVFYRKHLRIACRNLRFGITLYREERYAFEPSAAETQSELDELRDELHDAHEASELPFRADRGPFDEYLLRRREEQYLRDKRR